MSLKVKVTTNKYTILAACFCFVKHHWPLIMTEYVIGQPIIFSPCGFFFPRIFSAIGNWMSTHGLLKIQVAKNRHLGTITPTVSLELRHVSTIGKILVKQWYILHMLLQYGEPRPTNGWDRFGSLGTWQISMDFASCLHYCSNVTHWRPTKLHVWSSPRLVHCIYIFQCSCPMTEFCQVQNSLRPSLAFCGSITTRHSSSGCRPNFVAW